VRKTNNNLILGAQELVSIQVVVSGILILRSTDGSMRTRGKGLLIEFLPASILTKTLHWEGRIGRTRILFYFEINSTSKDSSLKLEIILCWMCEIKFYTGDRTSVYYH
jgi:hypothetical protein